MWRIFFFLPLFSLYSEVSAVYLSWYADPTTTMVIQWLTPLGESGDTIWLGDTSVVGDHAPLEQSLVHKVSLENLEPNTDYSFRIGADPKVYKFRTAPDHLEEPLRFVIGGDVYNQTKLFRRMCQTALETRPHFAVLGGDLAYAIHSTHFGSAYKRWLAFLQDWTECMTDSEGRLTPFLVVSGNHDIAPDQYETFFALFAFPKRQLYRAVDFGNYLSLLLLDTGHFQPIEGQQTLWLDKALAARSATPFRFAVYHIAAYPSHYSYQGAIPKKIRNYWVPLFEKHRLMAAFENHNHAFKRTHPIKAGQIDPSGVVYIGDGSWGVNPRKTNDLWYLDKKGRKNCLLLVELTAKEATVQALDLLNTPLDQITFSGIK